MLKGTLKTRVASLAMAAALVAGGELAFAPAASANSYYITCVTGTHLYIGNSSNPNGWASTTSNGLCGNVGMQGNILSVSGTWQYTSVHYYGTSAACWVWSYPRPMNQSGHWYLGGRLRMNV